MKDKNKYNNISGIELIRYRIIKIVTAILLTIIDIMMIYFAVFCGSLFNSGLLMDLSRIGMIIILVIAFLGMNVFQSSNNEYDESKRKIYIKYVFGIFPFALIIVFGVITSILFGENEYIIRIYSVVLMLMLSNAVFSSTASFTDFLKIKNSKFQE